MMDRVYKKLATEGFDELNSTFSVVFQTIGEGARLTEMAKKANLSKQNIKHLVVKMKDLSYLESQPDEDDARAIILKLSEKGILWRNKAYEFIDEVESEWAQSIGLENMASLKELLFKLGEVIAGGRLPPKGSA
jgi:DNA-binding MarR family transcriptional regulator